MTDHKSLPDVVVTRHRGAIQWIARRLPTNQGMRRWDYIPAESAIVPYDRTLEQVQDSYEMDVWHYVYERCASDMIPVRADVAADDIRGKYVVGVLPMHLASIAYRYVAVEFAGAPPRGAEYGPDEMDAAGARLTEYAVLDRQAVQEIFDIIRNMDGGNGILDYVAKRIYGGDRPCPLKLVEVPDNDGGVDYCWEFDSI